MNIGALIFMLAAWVLVLGLTVWSYWKLLRLPPLSDDESLRTGASEEPETPTHGKAP